MAKNKVSPCQFGGRRIKPHVRAFRDEIDEVRAATDSECVHRMRVASRRLRSTLPLFEFCFKKKQYRLWMRRLKGVARALGEARDTDVQLAFLDQYERTIPNDPEGTGAIERIRLALQNNRNEEQKKIIAALDELERNGVLQEISSAVEDSGRHGRLKGATRPGQRIPEVAVTTIAMVLEDFLSFESAVYDPENIEGHHALRIAAKRLRYTIEIFRPLYPDRLSPALRNLKHVQELLGQLHDCDVWIAFLPAFTKSVFPGDNPNKPGMGNREISTNEEAGILAFYHNRTTARRELYEQMVHEWETIVTGPLAEYLRSSIKGEGVVPGTHPSGTVPAEVFPAAGLSEELTRLYPNSDGHSRQVTRIALQLFDALAPLHGYSEKERRLLEYAGLLHDIGWAYGQKGHHTRSCRLILSDRTLPVSLRERTIIALVARYHRKAVPKKTGRSIPALKSKDRQRVFVLSALLRIADGLDYTHNGRVVSLSCCVTPDTVTCKPVYNGEGTTERSRALVKSDLFEEVFRRRFEIP